METREIWAHVLKCLRENNEHVLLSALSNLAVIFTHDSITIIAANRSILDLLLKHKDVLNKYAGKKELINIKLIKQDKKEMTLEQKLAKIFGDKLVVEV